MHLVEVLVATALFASVMTTVPIVFAVAAKANAAAADTTHATALAIQKMEELRSRPAGEAVPALEVERLAGNYTRVARVERFNPSSPRTWVLTVVVARHRVPDDVLNADASGAVRLVTVRTFGP